ncbi:hypothetical protein L6248_00745, partial [Candidatus Parcubacteria bacterium]|nr:hypothetical protein [Candidatus Parcubacteria bacterium]
MTNESWTEYWNAKNADYLKRHMEIKAVLEHRNVDGGEIYAVSLRDNGGFEVRYYQSNNLCKKSSYS